MNGAAIPALRGLLRAVDEMSDADRACWCTPIATPCEACVARRELEESDRGTAAIDRVRIACALAEGD